MQCMCSKMLKQKVVDATNAFNCLNRQVALSIVINTYRQHSQLFIDGESIIEGTTQGDPLAMAMYAVAITPLIHRLSDENING